eukprot:CAMPEP_0113604604 /NCGR_PEP_ID=MMETSP0017_2-20120614/1881_1 /TAXON_ID=2856 /ORGANISM="Cylindrotheca closterium" /LENGTH=261 /DNA_ID=CAMNT_0000513035 /DNA_START=163 /DNA_END=948 /DNA_ORIENTATION=+ /assembly_acc=CAM_ASM_000147
MTNRMSQSVCILFLICSLLLTESISAFTSRLDNGITPHSKGQTRKIHSRCFSSPYSGDSSTSENSSIRFLGKGSNAIVRPGVVLIAPADEFHHFMRESAVFIYAMGLDDHDEYVIRGVIIDHPTAFTIGEMMDGEDDSKTAPVYSNLLYRGGDMGGESAFMFHSDEEIAKKADHEMVGTSGIYQGGFEYAASSDFDTNKAKFFFHFMEFTEQELENMLVDSESDGDPWVSVEIPSNMVLSSEYDRGDAWARLRNIVTQHNK